MRLILALILIAVTPVLGTPMTGVVLSNHVGQGAHASGEISLQTKNGTRSLFYGEPLTRKFAAKTCEDIGAIWSIEARRLADGSEVIDTVSCVGKFDANVRGPWLVVREYLAGPLPASTALFSDQWRSSPGFPEYRRRTADLDTSEYRWFGRDGRCIDISSADHFTTVIATAGVDCLLGLGPKPVTLVFTLTRNVSKGSWQIVGISLQ